MLRDASMPLADCSSKLRYNDGRRTVDHRCYKSSARGKLDERGRFESSLAESAETALEYATAS